MRSFFSEKNLVVILFIMVLITFSLAQEDSRKLGKIQPGSVINDWRPKDAQKMTEVIPVKKAEEKFSKEFSR
ncbi:MAG TPA: hypothetical protein PKC72_12620 [Chitinophagaceae bacterium]|nr:hypothetical protein [Chitinophagaceae bacterium]